MGISTHHQDVCSYVAGVKECDVVFPLINKDGLGIRNGLGPGSAKDMSAAINKCHANGKGVFAMKVFGGGNLTAEYRECLDYVSSIEGVDAMVIGFTKKEEIDRAAEYAEGTLAEDYVPDMRNKKMFISQDDCIGCLSCKNRCPNNAVYINKNGLCDIDHSVCLTCGYCAPVCPVRALIMIDHT
jgi:Pyruvate/2-oxoacid:ferredoxin oxidoreductase delta subunit